MTDTTTSALRTAIYRLLRPLARIMLRHGMAYGSFAELARKAFVDECFERLGRDGQRKSISAVSAQTGLTRKEAKRLVDYDVDAGGATDQRYNRAVRVVTGWSVDPRFTDEHGNPRTLPHEGDGSFAALVREYSGDVTSVAMLSTLESSNTVRVTEDRVQLLNRAYLPAQTPEASLHILGNDACELISTIDHNISQPDHTRVFQRKVSNASVKAGALDAFRQLSNQKSQELLEEYHTWLSEHEISDGAAEDARYVAVGIYYFDNTFDEDH